MKLDPILTKAVSLARKGKYDASINTLEAEANRYYGSFTYYYILGLSYLYSKIFGVALTYLRLAAEQKPRDGNALLGLAALYLNHGDTDKAVDLYLEVQSIDASSRIARKALKIIRRHSGPETMSAWIDSGRLSALFPPFPKARVSGRRLALAVFAGTAALGLAFGIALKTGLVVLPAQKSPRGAPEEINLEKAELAAPVQTGGSYRYALTRKEVLDNYNEGRKLFAEYRDEAAKVRLNRVLESNASDPIKNKARMIVSYMDVPDFSSVKDRFSYSDVIKDPFIYRDCHVIWRGVASNLAIGENQTSFDFLVGYDTYRTFEGIAQVTYDFAIPVNPERPVEILGRIVPVSGEAGPGIRIQGVALNQAGLLDSGGTRNSGEN